MVGDTILVTGGAGYVGSHTVRFLTRLGCRVIALDNLLHGHREALAATNAEFVRGDVGDADLLGRIFRGASIATVVHFAGLAYVGESVSAPAKYYRTNIADPLVLLDTMREFSCTRFVFSSTCATYGHPLRVPIDEQHAQRPISPYGHSKLTFERILADYGVAYGLRSAILRYFNAAGASRDGALGEDHRPETHVIPRLLQAVTGEAPVATIFGDDHDTPDGTCIRDYVHVEDLASAHVAAIRHLTNGSASIACNLGTGQGTSVKDLVRIVAEVTGRRVPVSIGPRRPGDAATLVADSSLARRLLDWKAEHIDVFAIVESAWQWLRGPRRGRYSC